MRTTLNIEEDAQKAVETFAAANHLSRGEAASELIRRGARYELQIKRVNGIPVIQVPDDFPRITSEQVKALLEEE